MPSKILQATTVVEQEQLARTHLVERLGKETYQRSCAIGDGLAGVGVPQVWAKGFNGPPKPHLLELDLIVGRRNRITRECDVDPAVAGAVVLLSASDALDSLAVVEACAKAIDSQI